MPGLDKRNGDSNFYLIVNHQQNPGHEAKLDAVFGALADPTRRAILARLAAGSATVGDLATSFAISPPAISLHLKVLERAGLLARDREGRVHRCRLEAQPMNEAADWIAHIRAFWEGRLERLAGNLEVPKEK